MRTFVCWLLSKLKILAGAGIFFGIGILASLNSLSKSFLILVGVSDLIGFALAVWAAVFAYRNFDEVYSRRERWRNSNVEKLDSRFRYSLHIGFAGLFAFPFMVGVVGLVLTLLLQRIV